MSAGWPAGRVACFTGHRPAKLGGYDPRRPTRQRVRRALAMGIDRQRIVDNFYPAGTLVATQFMPPTIFGYTPEVTWYDFDPEAARALLAEAGYAEGFTIDLYYRDVFRSYLPEPGRVAEDIQAQLAENLNVTANITVMESGAFIDAADLGQLPVHLLGWNADYPDAENFLFLLYGPTGKTKYDGENTSNYASPEFDRLFVQMKTLEDGPAKQKLIDEMVAIVREEAQLAWLGRKGAAGGFCIDEGAVRVAEPGRAFGLTRADATGSRHRRLPRTRCRSRHRRRRTRMLGHEPLQRRR